MPDELRKRFEDTRGFPLDPFQRRALDALDAGEHVLVAAPTGSGKTVVAEYAVERALAAGTKAFYTTPLKALSNQKYADLVRVHGTNQVGLLTGDNSINGDAPIVVMTTEVLRNMIYAASPALDGLRWVVLDEVHYLQDRYRGPVWEEVIVHLDSSVGLVCLSATVSNAEEVATWIETVRGPTAAVIEEHRPVTLENRYLVGERGRDTLHLLPTFITQHGQLRANPEAAKLDTRATRHAGQRGRPRTSLRTPGRIETVERLEAEDMLPAIEFVFSRAGCDQAVQQCLAAGLRLTDPAERAQIRAIAEEKTNSLPDADLEVLRYDSWLAGLEAGFAAHHAGMVPPMKEAVEEAFAAGLAKVVFATETLALGINMPARSVVIEKVSKFTGERHEFLTPGEYTQLTGRAGRRGIDERGYAIVCWSPFVPFEQVASLASRRTDALRSSFRPTYNMAANLVRRYSQFEAHHLLNLSFAQFHADRDVVALERQLDRSRQMLERRRQAAQSDQGDVEEYRRLKGELDTARKNRGGARRVAEALDALRPGDVVVARRYGGRLVVLSHEHRRSGSPRIVGLSPNRQVVRLGPDDFETPPRRAATIRLPDPFAPRNPAFRRQTAERLRHATLHEDGRVARADVRINELEQSLAEHPAALDPQLDARLRGAEAIERLEREVNRLERRVRGRSESLARQFDRVLRVLEAWGYVDGWSLTPAGEQLARVYTETDLLVTEAISEGLLDGLRVPELAAVVSCFTYERRGPDGQLPMPPARWPTKTVAQRARAIERIVSELNTNEDDAGLPETRAPDPGFTPYVYDWAAGDALSDVLDDDEMTGGDFVRNVKQCIDLLRQIADVAPDEDTRAGTRRRRGLPPWCRDRVRCRRVSVEKGKPWGRAAVGPADLTVEGDDAALADAVARHPGARIAWVPAPGSDFARVIGLGAGSAPERKAGDLLTGTTELPCDALRVEIDGREMFAVNMVVLGVPPDEQRWSSGSRLVRVTIDTRVVYDGAALAVVVASGQYLRGNDVVPRGHPGDGRAEVQVYSLARGERAAMRERLPLGVHLPHPRIRLATGRRVEIQAKGPSRPVEVDGVAAGGASEVVVGVVPAAFTLLV